MFEKLFGRPKQPGVASGKQLSFAPYKGHSANKIYNLLFCDEPELFRPKDMSQSDLPWSILFAQPPDLDALKRLADDDAAESRVRVLAFNRLRTFGETVTSKIVLGVIVEVAQRSGLDTLAAYADQRVRYINRTGKMAIFEGVPPEVAAQAQTVVASAQDAVATGSVGPWDKSRLPPPSAGNIRITFLVSDGFYFGEGNAAAIRREALSAPIMNAATNLLVATVNTGAQG